MQAGNDEITTDELCEEFGVSKNFCHYWAHKPSRLRHDGSPALRSRPFANETPLRGRGRRMTRYRREDALAILAGKESEHPCAGKSAATRPKVRTDVEVRKIIKDVLTQKGPLNSSEMRKLAGEKRISWERFRRVVKSMKMRHEIRCEKVGNRQNQDCYYCLPRQEPPRLKHRPELQRHIAFLQEILADGRKHPKREILKAAKERGITEWQLYVAMPHAGVVREREASGRVRCATWRLRNPPQNGHRTIPRSEWQSPAPNGEPTSPPEKPRGRRGRPKGRDPEVLKREKEMLAAWDRGEFGFNKSAAGRAFNFHRQDATRIINAHERRKCKK
jgi:hypothetical protein